MKGIEEARKALEKVRIPEELYELYLGKRILDEPYKIEFQTQEEYERTKAMIEFCMNYEAELFQQFYKWFKLKGKED